ncbi:MAG: hypothetical protein ABFS32_05425, partial [Bacteroidota bacterium]
IHQLKSSSCNNVCQHSKTLNFSGNSSAKEVANSNNEDIYLKLPQYFNQPIMMWIVLWLL